MNERTDIRQFFMGASMRGPVTLGRVTHGLEILPACQNMPCHSFLNGKTFTDVCTCAHIHMRSIQEAHIWCSWSL